MGLFDFMRRAPEVKDSAVGSVMVMNPGQPAWSNRDYKAFADEAYRQNVVANRCVSSIAESVGSLQWLAYRGEQEVSEHPALALIERPNPLQSGRELLEAFTAYLLIAGNSYLEGVTVGQDVREVYCLRPDRMKVIPGGNGFPAAYEYTVGGRKVRWDFDPSAPFNPVWHSKFFNPTDDWYGLSMVEAGAFAVDQHNEGMKWMQALLQNSARPSGALVSEGTLSDDQFNQLKAQTEEHYQGSKNAGRPMLLEGGLDWKQMGLTPTDMGIIESKNSSARDICLAFGVPPMLIGIPGDNTYANYAEARLAFWEDTVIPLASRVAADLSQWLGRGEIELRPDLDQVPAIVEKRAALWDMLGKADFLTPNEKREAAGYDPIDGGDVLSQPRLAVDETKALTAEGLHRLAYGR